MPRRLGLIGAAAAAVLAVAIGLERLRFGHLRRALPRRPRTDRRSCPAPSGEATLTKTASGWRIELDATGLPRLDGGRFYEAWLRNAAGVLVPIGTFNEGRDVTLWAGVSPKDFTTLTVTREQADGEQASSGEKVLVGTVDTGGYRLAGAFDAAHHLLAGAVETAHHRALADPQGFGRLLVGEAGDVDGDEDVAEVVGKRGDRGVELAGLERRVRLARMRIGARGRAGRGAGRDAAGGSRSASWSGRCCAARAAGSRGRPRCGAGAGVRALARRSPGRDPPRPRGSPQSAQAAR